MYLIITSAGREISFKPLDCDGEQADAEISFRPFIYEESYAASWVKKRTARSIPQVMSMPPCVGVYDIPLAYAIGGGGKSV